MQNARNCQGRSAQLHVKMRLLLRAYQQLQFASTMIPILFMPLVLMSGFMVILSNMPNFWIWLQVSKLKFHVPCRKGRRERLKAHAARRIFPLEPLMLAGILGCEGARANHRKPLEMTRRCVRFKLKSFCWLLVCVGIDRVVHLAFPLGMVWSDARSLG